MTDNFTGSWLVSEYVYNPDGTFAGIIHQKRNLYQRENGMIRVVQECTPDEALKDHPMGAFAGEWVFDLEISGRMRRYHGPDVIGIGLAWGSDCITGRGVWPRFGHNFTSWGVVVEYGRQLTGGKFYNANEMIANIVGIAVSESDQFPELVEPHCPEKICSNWNGNRRNFNPDGTLRGREQGTGIGYHIHGQGPLPEECRQSEPGIHKNYGWLQESVGVDYEGNYYTSSRIIDTGRGHWIALKEYYAEQLHTLEITHLRAETFFI